MDICPQRLTVYLKEQQFVDIDGMTEKAERFLEARGQNLIPESDRYYTNYEEQKKEAKTDQ